MPGGGTTALFNKMNRLAWKVLALANETESALKLLNDELSAMRTTVIQHRLALDILLAEKGGVCKRLEISCCFFIPDSHNNLTSISEHMQQKIQTPRHTGEILGNGGLGYSPHYCL
uniref:Uncharacterized protein n=1 Tax=Electrophorus electricus TaxID=8005 RepID=A0AAY5EF26_ELEEL